jgi:hypothetical protein
VQSFVYFILAKGDALDVKIGTARDVEKRRRTLQTGNSAPLILLGSIVGGRDREKARHRQWSRLPSGRSEWFRADQSLLDAIATLVAPPPIPTPTAQQIKRQRGIGAVLKSRVSGQ